MLKNYEFKEIEIVMLDGETMQTKASTINDLGIHVENKTVHQFIPWTSIKKIKRRL